MFSLQGDEGGIGGVVTDAARISQEKSRGKDFTNIAHGHQHRTQTERENAWV